MHVSHIRLLIVLLMLTLSANVKASALPAVTGVSPAAGPSGTSVTITDIGFSKATAVRFGSVSATSFSVKSATRIISVTPGD